MNSFIQLMFLYGPDLVRLGIKLEPIIVAAYGQLTEGRAPTKDEWLLLDAHTHDDLAELVARAKEAQAELDKQST